MSTLEATGEQLSPDFQQTFRELQTEHPPFTETGVLDYGNGWMYESRLTSLETDPGAQPIPDHGTQTYLVANLSDGNEQQVQIYQPNEQQTDQPIVFTSAWYTSDRGHNRHTALKFAELGYPVVFIGPEGNVRPSSIELLGKFTVGLPGLINKLGDIELAQSAHNIHQILDGLAEGQHHDIDFNNIIWFGESRGAMIGMGVLAFAPHHDRRIEAAEMIAPCFPEPTTLKELFANKEQLLREKDRLGEVGRGISKAYRKHIHSTLNLSPLSILYQAAMFPTLISGQAGELAKAIPVDETDIDITNFASDLVSKPLVWQRIFAHHHQVIFHLTDGSHMTVAEKPTARAVLTRMQDRLAA